MAAYGVEGEVLEPSEEQWKEEEGAFEAFVCPLTKQVMRDPVTIETGQTFEREAILKWFRECRDNGRSPTCPLTQRELRTTETTPSVALRSVIQEWRARNEEKELDRACASLVGVGLHGHGGGGDEEEDAALRALVYVSQICLRSAASKDLVRRRGVLPAVAEMLKNGSRRLRLKSLQVLRVLVEDNDDNKEELGKGDTIRTIIKFLSNEHAQERELAVSLLHELSGHEPTCERIGAVYGAVLLLVGMASSKSESAVAVEKAENTLRNLDRFDANVKQMADNGRLQPLLTRLLQGDQEMQVAMADYLGELALANDDKAMVAEQAGSLLVGTLRIGGTPEREATLKALKEISSSEASAKLLLQRAGILAPLVNDVLFSTGHLPMRLKELAATILANLVTSGADFRSTPIDDDGGSRRTLLSEDVVHSLLHLISNTGPAIGCKLLSVLAGLTSSPATVANVVAAVKSSGATISLIQFIEAAHREIRVESLKLLRNLAPHMGAELADALGGSLSSLVRAISSDGGGGVTEEQAAAVGLLGDLPEGGHQHDPAAVRSGGVQDACSQAVGAPARHHPRREPVHDAADGGRGEGYVPGDVRAGGGHGVHRFRAGDRAGAALRRAAPHQRPRHGAALLGNGAGEAVTPVETPDGHPAAAIAAVGAWVRVLREEARGGGGARGGVSRARRVLLAAGDVLPGAVGRLQGGGASGGVPGPPGRARRGGSAGGAVDAGVRRRGREGGGGGAGGSRRAEAGGGHPGGEPHGGAAAARGVDGGAHPAGGGDRRGGGRRPDGGVGAR
ncbi:hypothetical protein ABZP36_019645 [Zizania latifolia]